MTRKIRLSQKILSRTVVMISVLILLSGFCWVNSMVSYKYEVQDTLYAKQPLDQHQKDILFDIASSKVGLASFVIILIFTLYLIEKELTFNGLIYYANKTPVLHKPK